MRRHSTYDEDLARELRNPRFAHRFLLSLMEGPDGMDAIEALKHTIRRMGIKEFSRQAHIHPKSVSRMLSAAAPPKIETLDVYLAPFGLMTRVVATKKAA